MRRQAWLAALAALPVMMAGCGGGAPGPADPAIDGDAVEVGPLLVRTASTAGFVAQNLPGYRGECAFVALHGARIRYLAARAMLDRFVFASARDRYYDIWVCNLDGSGSVQLTDNVASDTAPAWSLDGSMIAFQRRWTGQDTELITMHADGSSITAITNNAIEDEAPAFSPSGGMLAWAREVGGTNYEIYAGYCDGTGALNLSAHAAADRRPHWRPNVADPEIVFDTSRHGATEIYRMDSDGSAQTRVTNKAVDDTTPAWHPGGNQLAWQRASTSGWEIITADRVGGSQVNRSNAPGDDEAPCFSSDGRYLAFSSRRHGNSELYLQETDEPFTAYRVTVVAGNDIDPCLGSPAMQIERVLIGEDGADWGGFDPIWGSAYAGICAFDDDGYRNFVRIGIRVGALPSLEFSSMGDTGFELTGVVVEADEIVNLREDAGRGRPPTVWDLDPLNAGALAMYFSTHTGKLVSVLALRDVVYSAADGAGAALRQRAEGGRLVVEGDFAAVFDAHGRDLAPGGATSACLGGDPWGVQAR